VTPLVALTCAVAPDRGRHRQPELVLPRSYVDALEAVGLATVVLSPAHSRASLATILDRCHGLVLTGGEDVDPALYRQAPAPGLGAVSRERDDMELLALERVLERNLPVLGICRGCQVLNVFFGGTLYQDLGTERPDSLAHEQAGEWSERTHAVQVLERTRLATAIGAGSFLTNSFHHQAVQDVGAGLDACAFAADGVIEGIESRDHDWVVAVQWHPERLDAAAPAGDPDRRLFRAFRDVVERRAL